ncbi:MAG: hypothetical protein APZ16_03120 [Candidatus Hadarchaeum yellowstonense]|uniref:RNA polymerase sigma-70 region 4 domain-containing protein n=1 Tax=Hadarchaeum yellowstonense TaxID=1776334 RepID=A0A147JT19_HADYE|nr:MAG: hypothetical protein APZ16_03120 [Candidatus Hadarchaeum yellowstonense]
MFPKIGNKEMTGLEGEETLKAESWLRNNLLAKVLLERSHLDEKTLKALLLYYWSENPTFEDIAKKLKINRSGAWKRWKKGQNAIMRSFYTIELAIYSGILEKETAEILIDDLIDYSELAKGAGNVEEIRDRIERRMVQLARNLRG